VVAVAVGWLCFLSGGGVSSVCCPSSDPIQSDPVMMMFHPRDHPLPTTATTTVSCDGRSGKQASKCNILLRWAWNAPLTDDKGGDATRIGPAGFGAVMPPRGSRFLLMQAHVGYRLA
jgi:hypothetical protein